jgi:DNA-binding transcriptional MerR regulator
VRSKIPNGSYPIREFARLTGVDAPTLRAWEHRYKIIQPLRTDQGHRFFTEDQVEEVKRIQSLLEQGYQPYQIPLMLDSYEEIGSTNHLINKQSSPQPKHTERQRDQSEPSASGEEMEPSRQPAPSSQETTHLKLVGASSHADTDSSQIEETLFTIKGFDRHLDDSGLQAENRPDWDDLSVRLIGYLLDHDLHESQQLLNKLLNLYPASVIYDASLRYVRDSLRSSDPSDISLILLGNMLLPLLQTRTLDALPTGCTDPHVLLAGDKQPAIDLWLRAATLVKANLRVTCLNSVTPKQFTRAATTLKADACWLHLTDFDSTESTKHSPYTRDWCEALMAADIDCYLSGELPFTIKNLTRPPDTVCDTDNRSNGAKRMSLLHGPVTDQVRQFLSATTLRKAMGGPTDD